MMFLTFLNHRKNLETHNDDEWTPSPYKTSVVWAMESFFLDIYILLTHRINGLGLSLSDFWQWDTWTTSKIYCTELDLIAEEDKALNEDKDEAQDSDEMKDLYEEMWGDGTI